LSRTSCARRSRYALADRAASGVGAIDLGNLPPTETPLDRYLGGYHLLRQEQSRDALRVLGDPDVRRIPHAEELFLAFSDFNEVQGVDRERLALDRYADLVRLESRIGARTAATAHVAGRMLAVQGRFQEALAACEAGIALAPRAHVLRLNAGYAAFALGRPDAAREHLLVARELRPNYGHIVENLVWVDVAERRFEDAVALVRDAAPGLLPFDAGWEPHWSGVVEAYAALDARASGDSVARVRHLAAARKNFDAVKTRVQGSPTKPADTAYRILLALERDDPQALILALLDLLAEGSASWWRQEIVRQHMPAELDATTTAAFRRVLESLDTRGPSSRTR
jgi:tetratricopeptide (TPR) repeat protein